MPRLSLLLCTVAVAGSGMSALLYLRAHDARTAVEIRLSESEGRRAKLEAELARAHEHRGALQEKAASWQTQATTFAHELERAKSELRTADARVAASVREVEDVKLVLSLYERTAQALTDEVAALRQDLADARASEASPQAVEGYRNTIAELERQLANARNGAAVSGAPGGSTAVFASRAGRATVLTVGPESSFVVLNFGAARGAEIGQKLTVSQGAEVVATVLISDVRTNFSIAQVLPDSLRGAVNKGDAAVLLR